jgi:hypothetical protein
MSYTLYTDAISNHYKGRANNVREKIIALNEYTNSNNDNDISKLVEKYHILATEYDNIANNRLSDIDYLSALRGVDVAMKDVNTTQNSYIRDLNANLNENLSVEP